MCVVWTSAVTDLCTQAKQDFMVDGRFKEHGHGHGPRFARAAVYGLALGCFAWLPVAMPQTAGPALAPAANMLRESPRAWADDAAANQLRLIASDHSLPVRYRERKVDARGSTTREVIESRDGNVARLMERNGAPLTVEENEGERARLQGILDDPEAFLKRHHRTGADRGYASELVKQLPSAMLWSYVPGQPQLPEVNRTQIVLDFTPDPHYKPPSLLTEGLTGISGRVWIDAESHTLLRVEGHILHPLDFGWGGVLARVGQGGTVSLEQRPVGEHRWVYTHMGEDVTVREVLVHTVAEKSQINAWDAQLLPEPVSLQEAIHDLLNMPVATR